VIEQAADEFPRGEQSGHGLARDVLDLANDPRFRATLLVLIDADSTHWPSDLDAGVDGAACFRELDLGIDASPADDDPLAGVRAFEVVCP